MLAPVKVMVTRFRLQKETRNERQIKYETKTIKEKKTVMRKEKKKIAKIVMEK